MRLISEVISGISKVISSVYGVSGILSDDDYLTFGTSSDAVFTFTGLAGKVVLTSTQDVAIECDKETDDRSFILVANTTITLPNPVKNLYAKGSSKAGELRVLSSNYNVGKSDQELMDEAYVRK
jgi:hypothetical protein